MLRLAWRGVRCNPARYVATLVAIVTGVAFFAATGFVSDRVINALEGDVNRQYGNVEAAVTVDDKGPAAEFASKLRIPGAAADRIAGADGVTAVGKVLTGKVAFRAANGSTFADKATGRLWIDDAKLNPLAVVSGRTPSTAGQIAVDKGLAEAHDLAVGDQVTLLTLAGPFPATVVGITRFGNADAIDSGGTVSIPAASAFKWLSSGRVEYQELYLRGSVDEQALASAVEPLVPRGFRVQSGSDFLKEKRDSIGSAGRFLKYALQGFAVLAMLVGGFVIFNTFSVIVSQRLRELAVMAAIGATPRQIKRALRYEGLVLGLIGSVLGVAAGFALVFLLVALLTAFGVELPGSGIRITAGNVVPGLAIGTLITVVSVMLPARRAARTEPIEALQAAAVEQRAFSLRRTVVTLLLGGLGVIALLSANPAAVGFGALALFVAVIVGGPIIAAVGALLLRPLMALFGLEGRLAVDNARRNPKRTAITANALLIGVFLVTLISVAGTTIKDYTLKEIEKLQTADYVVVSTGGTIDSKLARDLSAVKGVTDVVPFRRESVTLDGKASQLFTGNLPALRQVSGIKVESGSFGQVGRGAIAVVARPGEKTPPLGSTVAIATEAGKTVRLKVAAIMKSSLDTQTTGNYVVARTFDSLVGATAPTVAFVDVAKGAGTDTKDAIETLVKQRPDVDVIESNAIGRLIASIFDFIINAVNGLLGMSVVIAVIGIVNTLSLSIYERRRELGLLRAVGMTDRRVQRLVRLEAVLISALGTVTGVALGLFIGWSIIHAIDRRSDVPIDLSIPTGRLVIILALGVVLGLLASLIPARRSTKLDVLDAIQAT